MVVAALDYVGLRRPNRYKVRYKVAFCALGKSSIFKGNAQRRWFPLCRTTLVKNDASGVTRGSRDSRADRSRNGKGQHCMGLRAL